MKYCSQCGGENPETARFCRQCGHQFQAAAPAPAPGAPDIFSGVTTPLGANAADEAPAEATRTLPPTPDPNINVMATQPIDRSALAEGPSSDLSELASLVDKSTETPGAPSADAKDSAADAGDASVKEDASSPSTTTANDAADESPAESTAAADAKASDAASAPAPAAPAAQPAYAAQQPAPQPNYGSQSQPAYGQQPTYAPQPNYAAPNGQPQPGYAPTGQFAAQPAPAYGQPAGQPYGQPAPGTNGQYAQQPTGQYAQPGYVQPGQPGYQQPAPGTPGAPGVPQQPSKFESEARTFGVWLKTFFSKPSDVGVGKPWYAIVVILAVALFSSLSCLMVSSHGGSAMLSMIPISSISSSIGNEASSAAPSMFMTLWIMFSLYDYGSLAIAWLMLRIEGDPTTFKAFHDRVAHALGPWAVLNIAAVLFALVRLDFLAVLLWLLATGTRAVWMTSLVWNGEVHRNLDPQWVRFLCVLLQSVLLGILLIILSSITGAILGSIVATHTSNLVNQFTSSY